MRQFFGYTIERLVKDVKGAYAPNALINRAHELEQPFRESFRTKYPRAAHLMEVIQDFPIYDTLSFRAGVKIPANLSFFVSPLGQLDPITRQYKTTTHTNLVQAARLPDPMFATFVGMRASFGLEDLRQARKPEDLHPELAEYIENTALELWLGNKLYYQAPVAAFYLPEDPPLAGVAELEERTEASIPMEVLQGQHFRVDTRSPRAYEMDRDFRITLVLEGLTWRAVQ